MNFKTNRSNFKADWNNAPSHVWPLFACNRAVNKFRCVLKTYWNNPHGKTVAHNSCEWPRCSSARMLRRMMLRFGLSIANATKITNKNLPTFWALLTFPVVLEKFGRFCVETRWCHVAMHFAEVIFVLHSSLRLRIVSDDCCCAMCVDAIPESLLLLNSTPSFPMIVVRLPTCDTLLASPGAAPSPHRFLA